MIAETGYVRLHRRLLGHHAFRNDSEALAFAWMFARASWAPVCVRYKERKIELKRGQLAISQRDMARALDRDKAWVERLWKRLKSEAMIETDVKAGVAVITICNYDEYQGSETGREAGDEADDKAGVRHRTKKGRKKERDSSDDESIGARDLAFQAPQPEWAEFAAHRKAKGKPMTPKAVKLNLAKLERLAAEGHDPRAVLNQSIENGWTGLFELDGGANRDDSRSRPRSYGAESGAPEYRNPILRTQLGRPPDAEADAGARRGGVHAAGRHSALPDRDRAPETDGGRT